MQYVKSPFKAPPVLAVSGTPNYLWGSYNDKTGPTLGRVISDSATGTTATVTFEIISGNSPIVTALSLPLITIVGTANSAGVFNVTNATVLTSSVTTSGTCTVTFTIAATAQATTFDNGQVIIPQVEVAEALANGASVPLALQFNNSTPNQGRTLVAVVSFPSLPTTVTSVTIQEAVYDIDAEYADIATVASVATGAIVGGQISIEAMAGRFYRFNTTGVSGGTSPSIIAKISS